jgi:enoyl-CoA hydratase
MDQTAAATERQYEFVDVSIEDRVGVIRLNRPKQLNALNAGIMREIVEAGQAMDADPNVGCIVIAGSERAFSAGADITEMSGSSPGRMLSTNNIGRWDQIRRIGKPIIAAVSGYAYGGGCELAMLCDMIVASETAKFGQPEINIGVMPGAGGTQRLTRAVGKYRAMEIVLTGEPIGAQEAYQLGLVNRVVPVELFLEEAKRLAAVVATKAPVALRLAKEAVNKSQELSLAEGIDFERRLFYLLFSTDDQKEGMRAFIEKRKPEWKGR